MLKSRKKDRMLLRKTIWITGWTILWTGLLAAPWATAQTVRYDLSVTIPAIPGINVPPFDGTPPARRVGAAPGLELIEEEIVREQHHYILLTYVAR